jgi:hydrogenase-4 component B
MTPVQAVMNAVAVLIMGAAVTAIVSRSRNAVAYLALLFVTVASALALWAGGASLAGAESGSAPATMAVVSGIGASLTLDVDRFTAFFLLIIGVVAFLSTLYSTSHVRIYQREHPARYYPILLLFFAGVIGVVSVQDWFFFLVFWEFMTICSYFLVIYDKEDPGVLRAGFKYIVITHVATILILVAAVVLWHAAEPHSFSFAATEQAMGKLGEAAPIVLHVLLALWLIGFATKAGILPFGDWLPDAYPAAPSGASAAFAGTMTNLGVYGLLRIFVDLLPGSQFSVVWGVVIALLGTGSIFVATLASLSQGNAKRLISFCIIGQMGYVFLAIGMGIYFLPANPKLALIGLLAGLFHLMNGVFYKSLLFFTTGSLRYRTGARDLGMMGGLARLLPVTAVMAGIGALSISGMPPFNGFASKWLIYQVSVIGGIGFPLFLLFGLTAMFISLVTLAALFKYLGAAFLGQPSQHVAHLTENRNEVPASMQAPQVILGLCCIAFGLFPMLPLTAIYRAVTSLTTAVSGATLSGALGASALGLTLTPDGAVAGVWHPLASTVALIICVALSYGIARLAQAPSRVVPVWYCGVDLPQRLGHFHAHGFYEPFRRAFERVYVTTGTPKAAYPTTLAKVFDVDAWLYGPLVKAGSRVAERFSRSHVGIPQWYLVWQVVGMVLVLLVLFSVMR